MKQMEIKMKKVVKSPFGLFEFDILWMAIEYAMNRRTAACLDLPRQILENLYRLSPPQMKNLQSFYKKIKFKDELLDKTWGIFFSYLDETNRYDIEREGVSCLGFLHNKKYYYVSDYKDNSCCLVEILMNNPEEFKITKINKGTSNV